MKSIFTSNNYPAALQSLKQLFAFPVDKMEPIIKDFLEQIHKGLAGEASRFKMIPTYMNLPTGEEKGYSLAIDMGGTNLRVMIVNLPGKPGTPEIILSRKIELSRTDMNQDAHTLFSIIARQVNLVLLELEKLNDKAISRIKEIEKIEDVGFTFSYPVKMVNRNSGLIAALAKELTAEGLLGEDPFKLLFKEMTALPGQAKLFPLSTLKPAALLNDTVTELIYGAYLKNIENSEYKCCIGGIIGTGNNFAIVLDVKDIPKFKDPAYASNQMIINMESGNFDAESLPKTIFDQRVDMQSLNPGFQQLEKMIAGNYLGRITGEIIKELINTGNLFHHNHKIMKKIDNLTCFYMSTLEAVYPENPGKARELLADIGIENISDQELNAIYEITTIVSTRAARIAGVNVGALIRFLDPELRNKHTVAIDGSVFGKYPAYKTKMLAVLKELFNHKADQIRLEYISDGSGIGAAIAAKCKR